jgi:hypothetical protein
MAKKKATLPAETQNIAETLPENGDVTSIADFALQVNLVAGQLTSNATELKHAVEKELQNYSVERYLGNPDAAKKDKAFLSKAEAAIKEQRIQITKNWNKPLDEFLAEMKSIESIINDGYKQLNNIVKEAENVEKVEKMQAIQDYFEAKKWDLVSLDRIVNTKWLNKSVSLKKVFAELDEKIDQIEGDLTVVIQHATTNNLDVNVVRYMYLESLNLTHVLAECQKLIQLNGKQQDQDTPTQEPAPVEPKPQPLPLDQDTPFTACLTFHTWEDAAKVMNYCVQHKSVISGGLTVSLSGTKHDLMAMRQFLNQQGITYTKR